jgi:PAS domain S-box-containing protein
MWQVNWQVNDIGVWHDYTSPRIEKLTGYSAEEWNASDAWKDRLHPHDRERVLAATARSETTGEPFSEEYRMFAKDGRLVVVFDHATLLSRDDQGRPLLFQGVMMDMTDQHRAEAFATQSAERYREFAEDGPIVFSVLEIENDIEAKVRLRYISPQIEDILGYAPARFYADVWNWLHIAHPDDLSLAEETSQRVIAGHPWDVDYRMIADDGRIVWMHVEGRTMERDDEGNPTRLQGIMMDITSRKEREVRIGEEATRLRSLIESMPGVPWMYAVDDPADWRPIYIAPQVEQLLGYTAAELMAERRFYQRLVHPDDLERILALAARSIRRDEPWMAEFRIITRDGRLLWLRSRGTPGRDDQDRPLLFGVWIDITAERQRDDVTIPEPNKQRER